MSGKVVPDEKNVGEVCTAFSAGVWKLYNFGGIGGIVNGWKVGITAFGVDNGTNIYALGTWKIA